MKNKTLFALFFVTIVSISFMLGVVFGRKSLTTVMIPENDFQMSSTLSSTLEITESVGGILDINTASKDDFILLPGIGEVLAQSIIDYRETNGPFSAVEDLLNVSGIGNKKLDAIVAYISVGG